MTIQLISKALINEKLELLKKECKNLGQTPKLRVILVGENKASLSYIKNKKRMCLEVGAEFELVKLDRKVSKERFLQEIEKLNNDPQVNGGFVQLPLPEELKSIDTTELIKPDKDVDGFGNQSFIGLIKNDDRGFIPCTPKGIVSLLDFYKIKIEGKDICIIGRSLIVGKPLSLLLQNLGATVTLCHSKTVELSRHTKRADIIISAVGKERFLNEKFFRNDMTQTIIDVGINTDKSGKICGDVNYKAVKENLFAISPVPGGVGPMTVISLIENLILATKRQAS